jgi:hypothetical protein
MRDANGTARRAFTTSCWGITFTWTHTPALPVDTPERTTTHAVASESS